MSENSFMSGEDTLISGPSHLACIFLKVLRWPSECYLLSKISGMCSLASFGDSGCNPDLESARVLAFQILR